ncbi:MAG: TonB family protein [Alphaproteobacteria bacterium]|nr:TonB family protein [Alphaproteobacteria bacterium]MBM3640300.1 TonB family protein [Alphaproteobacteria bacterium]
MNDSSGQRAFSATLAVAAIRRRHEAVVRPRFLMFLLLCLLAHLCVIAFLLWQDWRFAREAPPVAEEIPVEVITEPPAPKEEPPPPEPEKPPEKQEQQQQKPPPPPAQEIEKPAFDAPEAESKTKSDVNAPELKDLKTPKNAPEKENVTPKDEKPQGMKDAEDEEGKAKAPEEAKEKPIEDKSDAEIIEEAAPDTKPQEKPEPNEKGAVKKGEANSIADQLAALAPIPDYKLAAPPKPSPVGGGHAKTTYLTILYGLIMPHMHVPPRVRASQAIGRGAVVFYIDEAGNLTHQAVYQPSGAPDLDAAALAAVRRAAPFPPPPRGLPHSMLFSYATK